MLKSSGQQLAFWLLLPFAAPQGLSLRRRLPPFPAADGPTAGSVGRGRLLRVTALGDSIIAGVGAPTVSEALAGRLAASLAEELECRVRWSALGRVGAPVSEVIASLLPAVPTDSDAVVLSLGVNDVVKLRSSRRFRRELTSLLETLRERCPNALIVLAGLPPLSRFPLLPQPLRFLFGLRARTFDAIAERAVAPRDRCLHVPTRLDLEPHEFSPDGFHPSAASYAEWGSELAAVMAPYLRPDSASAHPGNY